MSNYVLRAFSGSAVPTDITTAITPSTMSIPLNFASSPIASGWVESEGANAGSVLGSSGNFLVTLDGGQSTEEHIICSGFSGNSLTVVTRGADQTTAVAHTPPASPEGLVYPILGGIDGYEANYAVSQTVGQVASKGDVITGSAANTFAKTSVGANGLALVANSSNSGGVGWAALALNPLGKSSNYGAASGDLVNATATLTVTSPSTTANARFGVIANYAASNTSPVTVTVGSGNIIGPGIPASTSSILLGAEGAFVALVSDGTNWFVTSGQQDTGWIATSSLGNSWSNGGTVTFQYRLIGNKLRFLGDISAGSSNATILTLPAGYRPAQLQEFNVLGVHTGTYQPCLGNVTTGGAFSITYNTSLTSAYLAGIEFTVD